MRFGGWDHTNRRPYPKGSCELGRSTGEKPALSSARQNNVRERDSGFYCHPQLSCVRPGFCGDIWTVESFRCFKTFPFTCFFTGHLTRLNDIQLTREFSLSRKKAVAKKSLHEESRWKQLLFASGNVEVFMTSGGHKIITTLSEYGSSKPSGEKPSF